MRDRLKMPPAATPSAGAAPGIDPAAAAGPAPVAGGGPATPGARAPGAPGEVPEKFRDPETGEIRVDLLLKSYLELERKLSGMVALPGPEMADGDRQRLMRAMGVPEGPDGYAVSADHGLFEPDEELNTRMHQAGFTPEQVQLVYDMAAERLVPLVEDMASGFEADQEIERLVAYFGGPDRWREVSRQMLAWAKKNLPAEAVDGLAASFDGVMALYRMMAAQAEPGALDPDTAGPGGDRDAVEALMRDPRYWRDKDPGVVAKVTEGFKRMYPEG
ncbi:MAG: hypothetical protein RID91_10210 [Azospirillaceae bacterium]